MNIGSTFVATFWTIAANTPEVIRLLLMGSALIGVGVVLRRVLRRAESAENAEHVTK